jgi:hypothetical protein
MFGLLGVVPGASDVASIVESADLFNRGENFAGSMAALGALPFVPSFAGILKNGKIPTFTDEITDAYSGQTNNTLKAMVDNKPVGNVDYTVFNGSPSVSMINTADEFRRQGVATDMLRELQTKFPDKEIDFGMFTDEGSKLYKSLPKETKPTEFAKQFDELDQLKKKRDMLMSEAEKFYAIETPTSKQRAAFEKVVSPLNDMHDKIYELETMLNNKSRLMTLIK